MFISGQNPSMDLSVSKKYKYLGLYFNEHMDDTEIVLDVAKTTTRALGFMISKYKNSGGLLYESFIKLYESCLQPVMLYGAGLWGSKEHKKLNTIQNRLCKFFLGVPKTSANVAVIGDMGLLSMQAKQKLEMLRLWCRLKCMDKNRLCYNIFKWSTSLSMRNIKTLEYYVKSYLKEVNMWDFAQLEGENVKDIIPMYRESLNVNDKHVWLSKLWDDSKNVTNGNKLRLYRCYKKDIYVENYVTTFMPFSHRQKLAMLRCGSLPLEIEVGRRKNIALQDRKCKMCTLNTVENEIHLLLECPLYDDIRDDILHNFIDKDIVNITDQYCLLLSNPNIQAKLGKCIYAMMRRRRLFIEEN